MEVVLNNKQAFAELLKGYTPSAHAKTLLSGMPLVILQGISGSGRNALISYLVDHSSFHQIVSDTTRPPKMRDGAMEQDGVQYFFRKEEEFLEDLRQGMFLEAELIHNQQVSGISIRELTRAFESGKIPINEVAREGVSNIRQAKPDTKFFFVVPPSYSEWLSRLQKREIMSDEELANRKRSAVMEIQQSLETPDFHFLLNDSVARAAAVIEAVVAGSENTAGEAAGRKAAQSILNDLLS